MSSIINRSQFKKTFQGSNEWIMFRSFIRTRNQIWRFVSSTAAGTGSSSMTSERIWRRCQNFCQSNKNLFISESKVIHFTSYVWLDQGGLHSLSWASDLSFLNLGDVIYSQDHYLKSLRFSYFHSLFAHWKKLDHSTVYSQENYIFICFFLNAHSIWKRIDFFSVIYQDLLLFPLEDSYHSIKVDHFHRSDHFFGSMIMIFWCLETMYQRSPADSKENKKNEDFYSRPHRRFQANRKLVLCVCSVFK